MDDSRQPSEGTSIPLPAAHWECADQSEPPPAFVPLRLVLQPSGLAVELTRPDMLMGRHSGADIRLPLPDVSRRHCRFVYSKGIWQVFDLESLNGVFVNGQRVEQAELHDQDVVGIGGFHFKVELASRGVDASDSTEGVIQRIAEALPPPVLALDPPQRKAS
jgi:pSer/pThr/pTyr-binding forkhead associated (FHA) protein